MKFRASLLTALLAASTLGLSACNSDKNDSRAEATPTPAPSASPSPAPTATPTPTPAPTPAPAPTPPPGEAGQLNAPVPVGATIESNAGFGCPACSVSNLEAILDPDPDNFATASVNVALLGTGGQSDLDVIVTLPSPLDPAAELPLNPNDPSSPVFARDEPGYVISFPDPTLLTLSLAPTIELTTLLDGVVVDGPEFYGFGFFDSLALGTPLQDINNARVFLGVPATAPYDAVRLAIYGAAADLLLNIDIHQVGVDGFTGSVSGDF